MAHVLARLNGVKFEAIKQKLAEDAPEHAENGMYLEHLWRNFDNPNEVVFLFRVNDLNHCKELMKKRHAEALQNDPNANLPELIFLEAPQA